MKAITTRRLNPTDTKGTRVVADDGDGNRIILFWDTAGNDYHNHVRAIKHLCRKMNWAGTLQGANLLRAGRTIGMVWVWVSKQERSQIEIEFPGTIY